MFVWLGVSVLLATWRLNASILARAMQIYREANIMELLKQYQHPNIVRFFGTVAEKPHYALVMEYWCARKARALAVR